MSEPTEPVEPAPKKKNGKEMTTQIITGVVGAIVVGLQSANLSETNSNAGLIRQLDAVVTQQAALIQEINQEGKRVDTALDTQLGMVKKIDAVTGRLMTGGENLQKAWKEQQAINEHQIALLEQIQRTLDDLQKSQPHS